jgi:TRAP-type C4-dicarboxylate transport system permease small subunit
VTTEDEESERLMHEPEAALAAHVLDPGHAPPTEYLDDSELARYLRRGDRWLGLAEQITLVALLATVVIVATAQTIAEKLLRDSITWSFEVVRGSVLAIAMFGAAFATYQQRNLSMDLVSRRLPPRGRMYLRLFLGLVTLAMVGLFFWGSEQLRAHGIEANAKLADSLTADAMVVGAGLIIVHTLIHMIIEVDYLVRGKISPEHERMGH